MANVFGKVVGVFESPAAGVDQFDPMLPKLDRHCDAVTGNAGHILHNADALVHQCVEQGTLADIRPTDDSDNRERGH